MLLRRIAPIYCSRRSYFDGFGPKKDIKVEEHERYITRVSHIPAQYSVETREFYALLKKFRENNFVKEV